MASLYSLTCRSTDRMYLGKTTGSVSARWKKHIYRSHTLEYKINAAIQQYGSDDFEVVELFRYPTDAEALEAEASVVHHLRLQEVGYNTAPGGVSPMKGRKHSPRTRHLLSVSSANRQRRPCAPETAAKIAATLRGRKHTPERCANMSKARKGVSAKPFSDEHRRALSVGKRGYKFTAAHCAAIAVGKRAAEHKHTPETRALMRESHLRRSVATNS